MGNLFAGLTHGASALSYYMAGIETAGHNIANSGVEGFSRQRVNVSSAPTVTVGSVTMGSGVSVDSITRLRNLFLDAQYRAQLPTLGYWQTRSSAIKNVELYTGQLDHGTLQTTIDNFWTALENLHTDPSLETSRYVTLSSTESMISSMLSLRDNIDLYRSDLNEQIADMVKEANQLIDDIAELCGEISAAQNRGENPNDLLDKRDLLAERLCKLTGATVGSPSLDETDGDYKIDINGKMLVQGGAEYNCDGTVIKNVRHLVLVPMVGNTNYYDVQVEYNQYDHVSDYSVATAVIERGATDPESCGKNGLHELFVERLANGYTWTVGGAKGIIAGGERLDTIYDKNQSLGISGSFSLEVGNAGVKASSNVYTDTAGVVKNATADGNDYEFRIAAGEFETYVRFHYDETGGAAGTGAWIVTRDGASTGLAADTIASANGDLTIEDIRNVLAMYPSLYTSFDLGAQKMDIEAANTEDMRGHLLSITDIRGTLAQDLGIANKNPAVEITVMADDSLTTIANKINAAYQTTLVSSDNSAAYATNPPGTAPNGAEEWLHANVIQEPNGSYYLALTSDVSGEANRINVLPGSVCGANGDFSVAKLLGLVESTNSTSYMQFSTDTKAATTIDKSDPYVNDAYFIYDGRHYLSESNSFKDARIFKTTDKLGNLVSWDNPMADELSRFGTGVRLNLIGLNHFYDQWGLTSGNQATLVKVEPHITNGGIYAMLEARDDLALGMEDYLDDLAYEMMKETNAIHYSGHGIGENITTTGTAYFDHINARYGASKKLSVNDALSADLSLIASGAGDGSGYSRGVGDGDTTLRMAQLKQVKTFAGETADFDEYFQRFIGDLGTKGYEANYMLEAQQGVCDQIQSQRDSVMGVSTDEEMLDIIKFQQGVGAIARYMTALDDMLDRVINGMGA